MFKNSAQFTSYLQSLIDRHKSDLSIILSRFGVDAEPTPQVLLSTFITHGKKFTEMLALLPEDYADGSGWAKFQDIFTKGLDVVQQGSQAYGQVAGALGALNPSTGQPYGAGAGSSYDAPPPPVEKKSETTKIIVIGAIVVVVLVVVFIVVKKLKK